MNNERTHRYFRKKETHSRQEVRREEVYFQKLSNCSPGCQEAASPEIASQSVVSVTQAPDMPAGRD